MSHKERSRLQVMAQVVGNQLTLSQAAVLLGISYRQARRVRLRYLAQGDGGLVHRLRGVASNRKTKDSTREAVLKRYRQQYAGFGPTLACEYLAKEGHAISHDTLWRWLRAEGLFERRRRRSKHRSRRDRRRMTGELVQMDGSPHDWFEGRGASCCLMVMVDDATGRVYARFYERETLSAAFDVFGRYAALYGLPRGLYVDRAGIYRSDREPTAAEQLAGQSPLTQFGRAMKDVGVELILANSPQAKGRVERMNQTLQDRLVKAMGLAGVKSIEAANAFLAGPFLADLNDQFCVAAADDAQGHREIPAEMKLAEVLCVAEGRVVGRDWCVQWAGRVLQIDACHEALGLAGKQVTVRELADGSLQLLWGGEKLTWRELTRRPVFARVVLKKPVTNNRPNIPSSDHPYNRNPACGSRGKIPVGYASGDLATRHPREDSSTAMKTRTVL